MQIPEELSSPLPISNIDDVLVGDVLRTVLPNQRECRTQVFDRLIIGAEESHGSRYLYYLSLDGELTVKYTGMAMPATFFGIGSIASQGRFRDGRSAGMSACVLGREFPVRVADVDVARSNEDSMYGKVVRALISKEVEGNPV